MNTSSSPTSKSSRMPSVQRRLTGYVATPSSYSSCYQPPAAHPNREARQVQDAVRSRRFLRPLSHAQPPRPHPHSETTSSFCSGSSAIGTQITVARATTPSPGDVGPPPTPPPPSRPSVLQPLVRRVVCTLAGREQAAAPLSPATVRVLRNQAKPSKTCSHS